MLRPLTPPPDAAARRAGKPVVVYPVGTLSRPDMTVLEAIRKTMVKQNEIIVPPRDARTFRVKRDSSSALYVWRERRGSA